MLIEINLQDGPLFMFAVAAVIVAVIFLFLAGVFVVAEAVACFFEQRSAVPGIYSWHLACGIVFLVNLLIAVAFTRYVPLFNTKEAEAFISAYVDAPFYIGIPVGLVAMGLMAILLARHFDKLIVKSYWNVIFAAISAVTICYVLNSLLLFMRSFDIFGVVRGMLKILNTDPGFYLLNLSLIAGLFFLNFKRLSQHAKLFVAVGQNR